MTKKNKRSYKNVLKQLIKLCKKLFDGEFSPKNWMVDFEIRYVTAQTKKNIPNFEIHPPSYNNIILFSFWQAIEEIFNKDGTVVNIWGCLFHFCAVSYYSPYQSLFIIKAVFCNMFAWVNFHYFTSWFFRLISAGIRWKGNAYLQKQRLMQNIVVKMNRV